MFFLLNLLVFQFHTLLELGVKAIGKHGYRWCGVICFLLYAGGSVVWPAWILTEILDFVRGEDFIKDAGGQTENCYEAMRAIDWLRIY
jgi:hypothetical protein